MAQDTLVTGSKLTAIANAIRTRGGTQAQLTLDQMPAAVEAIPGGGGGFDWSQIKGGIKFTNAAAQTALDLRGIDTSTFTTMESMFNSCGAITSIDVSGFDTSHVTTMSSMFYNCSGLTSLTLPSHDFGAAVTSMNYMFQGCSGLTSLDLSTLNTGSVTAMSGMFNGCSGLTSLNLSGFNTGSVTSMPRMFNGCSGLTSLNLSGFNTGSVTSMDLMFAGCSNLVDIIWSQANSVQPIAASPERVGITNSMKFYVPDDLVNAYKSATNWSTIASQIYPISQLPASVAALYGMGA